MLTVASLGALVTSNGACGADTCATPCETRAGVYRATTTCDVVSLAALQWRVEFEAREGACVVTSTSCQASRLETDSTGRACDSGVSSFRIGNAICAVTLADEHSLPTGLCRLGADVCEFAFALDSPIKTCAIP